MTPVEKTILAYLASKGVSPEEWGKHLLSYLDDYTIAWWFEEAWLADHSLEEDFAEFEGSDIVDKCVESGDPDYDSRFI